MRSKMDLQHASQHFRLLSDSTRLRLLMLVDREELSVAELSAILGSLDFVMGECDR